VSEWANSDFLYNVEFGQTLDIRCRGESLRKAAAQMRYPANIGNIRFIWEDNQGLL